ncbi:fimbrial protein [Salinivibrio sp. YCSC6]|uniref:fimbrial protein n=1 Tax=Salinivibrio sp. YCSC6 TaxID=2003370 RepID=UPI000BBBE1F6|nr:fimbrial protein [Salinivibrio sp. YCSC6]PCE65481.1 hypothetical protein B6G00_16055 [Salinivibrio sp. YCSC6]QCF37487.1 hypothetical protein E8E00_14795 [Salinivibrio sp. YCSC6]
MQITYLLKKVVALPFIMGFLSYFALATHAQAFYGPIPKCVRISHAPSHPVNKPNSGHILGVQQEHGTTGKWIGATDTNYANMTIPNPNIADEDFQKVGTVLSSTVKSFIEFAESGRYSPDQVLYKCPASYKNSIYEMYSTNGDYRFGGYDEMEVGKFFGMPNVYSTKVKGLGFRITNLSTGEHFSHNWKARQLTNLDRDQYGNILVKAKNFSNIKLELIRIPDVHPSGNSHPKWSGYDITNQFDEKQPLGYFAVRLPLNNANKLEGPRPGLNHKYHFPGWYAYWPGTIGLHKGFTVRRLPTCKINFITPSVTFPQISVNELNMGIYRTSRFSVSYNCQSGARRGSGRDQVSMSFLPSSANFKKAEDLSLVNNGISTPYLLTENYDSENSARGVAVTLYDQSGSQLNFSNPDKYLSSNFGQGKIIPEGNSIGNGIYNMEFEARLGKIPVVSKASISPGKYRATARVVMRVN